ncbi:MAG: fatty acid desaturase [Planctomycetota bacterium]
MTPKDGTAAAQAPATHLPLNQTERDWVNISFIASANLLAVVAIFYLIFVHFSWWTVALGFVYFAFCGLSITGGYHRHFSHPTYKAHWLLRAFYLFFGAASVQNSALKWSDDHRRHHAHTDTDQDPYNIKRGFWWAHIGWVLHRESSRQQTLVGDLMADPLVRFQDRYYIPIAVVSGALLPFCLGLLWGDPWGALLVAGFLRLAVQWHATFSVNSFAHMIGRKPYDEGISAQDSFLTALITLGEGYHNFHHRFPMDYRNGVRWWQPDPTKWVIWTASWLGLTWDLRRTTPVRIQNAIASRRTASR